jgi:hypothetical protein
MAATVTIGLAVTSHDVTALNTSTFDNVAVVSTAGALPAGWANTDVGAPLLKGTTSYTGGTFSVAGAGWDVWGLDDQFQYVWRPLPANGTITARLTAQTNTNPWAKAGVMVKASTAAGTNYAMLAATPGNGLHFQWNFSNDVAGGTFTVPVWLRLRRVGNTVTAFRSVDGVTWTQVAQRTFTLPASVTIGLFVTSHDGNRLGTATFDRVTVG